MNKNNIIETDILLRFLASETTGDETEKVQNWLAESADNMEYFQQVKALWDPAQNQEMLDKKYLTDSSWNHIYSKIQKPVISFRKFWMKAAVAASILIISGAAIGFYLLHQEKEELFVSNSKVSKITFPDSSVVWVNRNSKIYYKKNFKTNRHIELTGEAYFQVTPDASHPFTITTNNAIITVIGTKFNVKAYSGDTTTEVTVTSGKVKIASLTGKNNGKCETLLLPGEKGISLNNSVTPAKEPSDNPNYMAWKTHDFTFNNTNIKDIIVLVNEIYNTHIILENTNTENCNITGKYSCHSLDDILDMLHIVLNVTIDMKGESIIIKANGC